MFVNRRLGLHKGSYENNKLSVRDLGKEPSYGEI